MREAVSLAAPADIVVLGRIVGAHGLNGAVKVFPFADDPAAWSRLKFWWLGQEASQPGLWRRTKLLRCRVRDDQLVAELEGMIDRNAAEAAQGLLVGVPQAELPAAGEDEYYWADLIGLEVINSHDESLGCVLGLIETPANDVLRVSDGAGKERLLPFVGSVVLDVDRVARRIRVEWESDW